MRRESATARCDIAVLVDEEVGNRNRSGRFVVDRGTMENYVLQVLRERGTVSVVPFVAQITPTVDELRALKPRLVFNLTEWLGGDRRLDAAIAGVLEMMKLPYTGSGPDGMHLARDKALAKDIVAKLGIPVARHVVVNGRRQPAASLTYPVIVKPQFGDASEGMSSAALVASASELKARLAAVRRRIREPLLCEEFIEGRDLFVGLLGNEPRVMSAVELVVGRRGPRAPRFATSSVKNDAPYRSRWRVRWQPAKLPDAVVRMIEDTSRRVFHALKLRDYARIDYRLTTDHRLFFLEANPNPDLGPHSFGRDRCLSGLPYGELISGIVSAALARPR